MIFTAPQSQRWTALLVGVFSSILLASGTVVAKDAAPPKANLLLDSTEITHLREKVAMPSWENTWSQYKGAVDARLSEEVVLPPRGGNHSHNYVCPEHQVSLRTGKQIADWQWEHTCRIGPHILHGDPSSAQLDFDGNAIMNVHSRLSQLIRDLGVVYQVTGDDAYAAKAAEVLAAYTDKYLQYPIHNQHGEPKKGARVAAISLSEASWIIPLLQGADLVWATLDPALQKKMESDLIRPAIEDIIMPSRPIIHNIHCWYDSAIGLAGYLLNDTKLITYALDAPGDGMRHQLAEGVNEDGMWYEGSSSYHDYTMSGMWPLIQAASHHGIDLFSGNFKKMFDAPLFFAMPNLTLPNFNDSGFSNLKGKGDMYEWAYAHWQEPLYVPLIEAKKRTGNFALWFGVPELGTGSGDVSQGSRNSLPSGYAILEKGKGSDATWLCLKYGPHGGSHGHHDKNHFLLYSRGRIVMPDSGMHLYSSPLHKTWDKTTVAHNALVVDEETQERATGRSVAFGSLGEIDYSITEAGEIYPDVKHYRTAALIHENLIVFIDQVQAKKKHQLDLVSHFRGIWEKIPEGESRVPSDKLGYQNLAKGTASDATQGLDASVKLDKDRFTRVVVAASKIPTEAIVTTGPGESTVEKVPTLILRQNAKQTAIAWAVTLDGSAVEIAWASADKDPSAELAEVVVKSEDKSWKFHVAPESRDEDKIFQVTVE